jgi:hypothetical protein
MSIVKFWNLFSVKKPTVTRKQTQLTMLSIVPFAVPNCLIATFKVFFETGALEEMFYSEIFNGFKF